MLYVFLDESGSSSIKNGGRFFFVAAVLFGSLEDAIAMQEKIDSLKKANSLPRDYEFHFSRNAPKNKNLFVEFIKREKIDHRIFKIVKEKGKVCIQNAALEVAGYLEQLGKDVYIRLDSNPIIFDTLRRSLRGKSIKVKIIEVKSKNNNLVQLADYFAGMAAREEKLKKLP